MVGKPMLPLTELTMRNLLAGGQKSTGATSWPGPTCSPPAA